MAMVSRSHTPVPDAYSVPHDSGQGVLDRDRGYGALRPSSRPNSYAGAGSAYHYSHGALEHSQIPQVPHNPRFKEDFETASNRSSVVLDGPAPGVQRSASQASRVQSPTPTHSSTLRKKPSLSKKGSIRRNGSRRSLRAGSVRSLSLGDREKYNPDGTEDLNSAFTVPIPTTGNPTEALANRFQGM